MRAAAARPVPQSHGARAARIALRSRVHLPRMRPLRPVSATREDARGPVRAPAAQARSSLRTPRYDVGVVSKKGSVVMLYWAAVFFVIALVAAVLGFSGLAAGAAGIAKILFFVFLVLGALSLIFGRRVPA